MKTATIALLAASALALAACHSNTEEPPVAETNVTEVVEPGPAMNVITEAPPAPRIDNTAENGEPPKAELSADAQTQDDADATGMTARVNRDEGGNDSGQPAQ